MKDSGLYKIFISNKHIQKAERYEVNISVAYQLLYINIELAEKEHRKEVPFILGSKRKMKFLEVNLTKDIKEIYSKNLKTLEK